MARRGQRQPGRQSTFNPALGVPYRLTILLSPEEAVKAIEAARCADLSMSGFMAELVRRVPVDDDGCPGWVKAEQREVSDPLPLASGG